MNTEDDIVLATEESPDEIQQELPDSFDTEDSFLSELMRSQFQKKVDLVSEIEDHALMLADTMSRKVKKFVQRDAVVKFREISMFERSVLKVPNSTDNGMFMFEGDEQPVACFLFGKPSFQQLLTMSLKAGKAEACSGDLSVAENRIFSVFIDFLGTALFETVDVIPLFGIAKKPRVVYPDEFFDIAKDGDLVCFTFDLTIEELEDAFVLMAPLAIFDSRNTKIVKDNSRHEPPEDTEWKDALFNQIENLKIPLQVELASGELLVSQVDALEVGQELKLSNWPETVDVYADLLQTVMSGEIQVSGKKLNLRVTSEAN